MASERDEPKPRKRPATAGSLANHLSGRVDPLTSAILVFPLFLIYQAGILASAGQNGVDFVTSALIELSARSLENYLIALAGMLVAYAAVLIILRRRGSFHPRAFVPVLIESTFYALTMGTLIIFVMDRFIGVMPGLYSGGGGGGHTLNPLDVMVISAGAGLHEELIFRVILMGGMAWLLAGVTGEKRAWLVALVVSSLMFSIAHHIGPAGEPFSFGAFTYRALAGAFFAIVYHVRGFAVAAWTHALYDVYVMGTVALG